jgi:hypothetical protein
MPEPQTYLPSAIGAASGISVALIGIWVTGFRERRREKATLKSDRAYSAMLIVTYLDRLTTACLDVALDNGTAYGQPAGEDGQTHTITVTAPTFDALAISVPWRSLPSELAYQVLSLPHRLELLARTVSQAWENDFPPDYSDMFWTRQAGYAGLGLEIIGLVRKLQQQANLEEPPARKSEWNQEVVLLGQKKRIEQERDDFYARIETRDNELNPDQLDATD